MGKMSLEYGEKCNKKKFLGITPRDIRIPDDRYVQYN